MATKKYLSLDRLAEYDELLKKDYGDKISAVNTSVTNIVNGTTTVPNATNAAHAVSATDSSKLGGQLPAYYAKATDIPTGTLAKKNSVSESDLDSALAEKVNAASEGNHSHSNKTVLDGITSDKVSAWDNAEANAKAYTDTHAGTNHAPGNAERNVIVGVQRNGTDVTPDSNRKVNITVPTTASEVGAYTTGEVDNKITTAVSTHNSSTSAHSDIRATLAEVKEDVDAFFKDATISAAAKDTLKEIQDYITSDVAAAAEMTASINNKSDKGHKHTKSDITDFDHNHDDRYYTETEVDNLLKGKSDTGHKHEIGDVNGLQTALDGKAPSSHGTHVEFDSASPKMDGTASAGTSTKVARADHIHPTDTTRAAKSDFDSHTSNATHITSTERTNWNAAKSHADSAHAPSNAQANVIESIKVNGTAQTITSKAVNITVPTKTSDLTHDSGFLVANDITNKANKATTLAGYGITDAYTKGEVDAKTVVDSALSSTSTNPVQNKVVNSAIVTATQAITANTNSINAHTDRIGALETKVGDGFEEITSADIQNLFK